VSASYQGRLARSLIWKDINVGLWLLYYQNTVGSLSINFRHSRYSVECCKCQLYNGAYTGSPKK